MLKMKHLLSFFTFFIFVCLYAGLAVPDELHIWTDKKGNVNITDREPDKPAKIIGKESNKLDSREEIERYNAERKAAARQEEMLQGTVYRTQPSRRYHDNMPTPTPVQDKSDKAYKAEREKDLRAQEEYLEAKKARLRAIENKDYREAKRQRLKGEKIYNEREIEKTKDQLQ